ncbi:MAG TPA: MarR family transcriptional regulator [Chitinophagaceae bacterium]|nr:MarR family transcriptional regulator [Chitinophagaceae bacterium]HAN39924.1 MarR family transcriptional regulator [Chitinophagaceae bacterium]
MVHFLQSVGLLFFGSRLKRISDSFLLDVNKVYQNLGIPFEAAWFPVFFILSQKRQVAIREIAEKLGISHSAASQMVSNLQERGLIESAVDEDDARKKLVTFTAEGAALLLRVEPVWEAMQEAMEQLMAEGEHSQKILDALCDIENSIRQQSVLERVETQLKQKAAGVL